MKKTLDDMGFTKTDGEIRSSHQNLEKMKSLLNSTGPGFCLAKWTQVTMHLGVGLTHSCHHPGAHHIPLEEIKVNPGALHNTQFKKEKRKEMLRGERPAECDFCWRIEDNTKEYSDRIYKSIDGFSINDHDMITQLTGDENIYPRYVEVSFSNVCNFKCSYCGPTFSSKWIEEINTHGPYKFSTDGTDFNKITDVQIAEREENPYIEAFWKWFPHAVEHMHTFRITGGEPLLNKNTLRVIDHLIANPNPDLEFAINSNGNPPQKLWLEFTEKVNILMKNNCIKKFTLFTSAESSGVQAEYSRYGMNWEVFENNIDHFLKNTTNTRVVFMAAFNILSLPTFKNFLEYVLDLKRRYNKSGFYKWLEESGIDLSFVPTAHGANSTSFMNRDETGNVSARVGIDIPYVRSPQFLDCNIASHELVQKYLVPSAEFMFRNTTSPDWDATIGFEQLEAVKLKRILVDVLCTVKDSRNSDETSTQPHIARHRARFYEFVNENDRRKGTNFLKAFPEYTEFMNICKLELDKRAKK